MIVCIQHKVVFIAVPKTGTRSIYDILQKEYGGKLHKEHETTVPRQYQDFFTFCVTRNPYDRACSAYWSTCHRAKDQYGYLRKFDAKGLPNTLESFLVCIKEQQHPLEYPQYRFHENNRFDVVLRFESLRQDFAELPFIKKETELPVINPTTQRAAHNPNIRPSWKEMITPTTGQMINDFFAKDFELFGYELLEF
jgi:hypothetical protein